MKLTQEIVEKLKNNLAQWDYVSVELQKAFKEVGHWNCDILLCTGRWRCLDRDNVNDNLFCREGSYRLRPDYELPKEKKMVRYEITVFPKCKGGDDTLRIYCDNEHSTMGIGSIVERANFSHFEDDSGNTKCLETVAFKIRQGYKVYAAFEE
jgi:hypothetical protein